MTLVLTGLEEFHKLILKRVEVHLSRSIQICIKPAVPSTNSCKECNDCNCRENERHNNLHKDFKFTCSIYSRRFNKTVRQSIYIRSNQNKTKYINKIRYDINRETVKHSKTFY